MKRNIIKRKGFGFDGNAVENVDYINFDEAKLEECAQEPTSKDEKPLIMRGYDFSLPLAELLREQTERVRSIINRFNRMENLA